MSDRSRPERNPDLVREPAPDSDRDPPTDDSTDFTPAFGSPPGVPGWVIAIGVIAVILIAFVAVTFVLGIQHGPGMHGG